MARRMTDTEKWSDPWYRKLSLQGKALFGYICDRCSHAGIWKVDRDLAEFQIGSAINWEAALAELGDRIQVLSPGDRWYIRKFVVFQYGKGPKENPAHKSVLAILEQEGLPWVSCPLIAPTQPLPSPCIGAKDKESDEREDMATSSLEESAERRTPAQCKAELKALLIALLVADGPDASRRWWALAEDNPKAVTFDDRLDLIEWSVRVARKRGIEVKYASDVLTTSKEWLPRIACKSFPTPPPPESP